MPRDKFDGNLSFFLFDEQIKKRENSSCNTVLLKLAVTAFWLCTAA